MGDMADYALDQMMDIDEIQQNLRHVPFNELDDYEREVLYEYDGSEKPLVFSGWQTYYKRPSGPGPCPKCQAETRLMKGQFGQFYGCPNFPKCKGSRNP